MRRAGGAIFVAVVAAMAVGMPAGATDRSNSIRDNYYGKAYILVSPGDAVTWTNQGGIGHTVVAYDGSFDSSPGTTDGSCTALLEERDCIPPGGTYQRTFGKPGTYDYYCKVDGHADTSARPDPNVSGADQPCGMCGRIVVKTRSTPKPPPRTTPPATVSPSPSPSKSPKASPRASASPTVSPSPGSTGTQPPRGDGASGQLGVAFVVMLVLGGAGYVVYRKFIAQG